MTIIQRADAFAFGAHGSIGQVRKYTGEPYIEHPRAVAALMDTMGAPEAVVAAALLHDTIEDVPWVTADLLRSIFGDEVTQLVVEVTDVSKPSDGNRAVRKAIDRDHLAAASAWGQSIKVADLLHNRRTIVERAPKFAPVYMAEMAQVLDVLTHADPCLLAIAWAMVGSAAIAA